MVEDLPLLEDSEANVVAHIASDELDVVERFITRATAV